MIRVPAICNHDPRTTVLCHLRMIGLSGIGIKAMDFFGAYGCSACHEYVDTHGHEGRVLLIEGVMRTQSYLIQNNLVSVEVV